MFRLRLRWRAGCRGCRRLLQPYAQVDTVGPDVDVVRGGQVALAERLVVGLPLGGQPGDGGRGHAGRGAEELLERGHEVPAGQAVEVEERQHLVDLRGLAAPRRQGHRGEPVALAGCPVDALVVDAWGLHLDRPGRGGDLPGLVMAVADHQAAPALLSLVGQLGNVGVDFSLQSGGQHPPRALADDVVDQGAGLGRSIGTHYAQHGRAFPTDGATSAYSMTRSRSLGKVRPSCPTRGRSTGHEHCSPVGEVEHAGGVEPDAEGARSDSGSPKAASSQSSSTVLPWSVRMRSPGWRSWCSSRGSTSAATASSSR